MYSTSYYRHSTVVPLSRILNLIGILIFAIDIYVAIASQYAYGYTTSQIENDARLPLQSGPERAQSPVRVSANMTPVRRPARLYVPKRAIPSAHGRGPTRRLYTA